MGDTLASAVRLLNPRPRRTEKKLPPLILMSDPARFRLNETVLDGLPRGSAVILRDYDSRDRRARAHKLAALCRARHLKLLIGGDGGLAGEARAAGMHFPERLWRHARAWRRARPDWLITIAAHSWPALVRARDAGADAALLSPVFQTPSHPDRPALGTLRFAALSWRAEVPVYALGGVAQHNARRLKGARLAGLAGIGGLIGGA